MNLLRPLLEYARQFGRFQRNARLYLVSNALSGVTTGILLLLYNLYLVSLGYKADFVGLVLFVGAIGAGLAIFPAGVCVDRFRGKSILIWSNLLIGLAGAGQILFRQPVPLLVSAFIAGVGIAFVLVINAPFLTRNSAPEERPHLFSLNIVLGLVTTVLGNVLGGALPVLFIHTSWLMAPLPPWFGSVLAAQAHARSYQLSLLFAGAIAAPSFIPFFMMKEPNPPRTGGNAFFRGRVFGVHVRDEGEEGERGQAQGPQEDEGKRKGEARGQAQGPRSTPLRPLPLRIRTGAPERASARPPLHVPFRSLPLQIGIVLRTPLFVLALVQVLIGFGAGLFIPYFNIYFVQYLKASPALFGLINGGAIATTSLFTLAAPWLALHIGRVKTIVLTELSSIPLLLIIGLVPVLPLVAVLYLFRQGFMDMSNGILQVFSMEAVPEQRRGLANSCYQAGFQVANALATPLGGLAITYLGYPPIFVGAAICYLLGIGTLWGNFGVRREGKNE